MEEFRILRIHLVNCLGNQTFGNKLGNIVDPWMLPTFLTDGCLIHILFSAVKRPEWDVL